MVGRTPSVATLTRKVYAKLLAVARAGARVGTQEVAVPVIATTAAGPRVLRAFEADYYSVCESTRRSYMSHLRTHHLLGYPQTYDGLMSRILLLDTTACGALEALRSAMQWALRVRGAPPMTEEQLETIRRRLRARRQMLGVTAKRGAITWDLLVELIGWLVNTKRGTLEQRRELIIAWGTGLRSNQVQTLRRHHFSRVNGKWVVTLDENHNPRRLDHDNARQMVQTVEDRVQSILDAFLPTLKDDELVCPEWTRKVPVYREWIKAGAAALKWPDELKWVGVHQLRHGVAVEVRLLHGQIAASVQLGHQLPAEQHRTSDTYSEPNEKRIARVQQKRRAAPAPTRGRSGAPLQRGTTKPQPKRALRTCNAGKKPRAKAATQVKRVACKRAKR